MAASPGQPITKPAATSPGDCLVGRERECRRLSDLVSGLPGSGGSLQLVGEAGTGKSALLAHVAADAEARGARVLNVCCSEAEREISGAAIANLLLPLRQYFSALPSHQRRALEAELALTDGAGRGSLAECAGALGVLSAAAAAGPMLITVDDLQWVDPLSGRILGFLAHRIGAEPVAMVLALRDEPGVASTRFEIPELRVPGLTLPEYAELADTLGLELPAASLRALAEWTGGNPLALVDRLDHPRPGDGGTRDPGGPPALPASLQRGWVRAWHQLPPTCRSALFLLVAGSLVGAQPAPGAFALMGVTTEALIPAEERGLVVLGERGPHVPHPLLRAVVHSRTPAAIRSAGYRALAETTQGHVRAWFTANATTGTNDGLAAELADAAGEALVREGLGASARLMRRAAELTGDAGLRARRMARAAEEVQLAGDARLALEWCTSARREGVDPGPMVALEIPACRARAALGDPSAAFVEAMRAAGRVEASDPGVAARMLAEAIEPAVQLGDGRLVGDAALRAHALLTAPSGSGGGAGATSALVARGLVVSGELRLAGPYLEEAAARLNGDDEVEALIGMASLAQALMWAERFDEAGRRAFEALSVARLVGAASVVPLALSVVAECDWWRGAWTAAHAKATEALRVAGENDQRSALGASLCLLARLEASTGQRDQCRARVRRARREVVDEGAASLRVLCESALGLASLSCGDLTFAAAELQDAWDVARRSGLANPNIAPMAGDLAEALARLGEADRCAQVVAWLDEGGRTTGLSLPGALGRRAEGVIADPNDAPACFAASLEALGSVGPLPFQEARTLLCLGESLRRAREPGAARGPLARACTVFEGLGATTWLARAEAELAAAGVKTRAQSATGHAGPSLTALSPQESQVARAVGQGLSNREIADSLFVSTKTVEAHLTRAYRKLGVRSRTELARLVLTAGPSDGSPGLPAM